MNATRIRRKNPFRPLLYAGGAIVVLGVAGYVVLASALDPQKLQGELQDAVLRATGRTLTVTGGVHLRIGLSPQFEVDDIALSNVEGGSRPNMLTAKALRAELALFPLLGGDAVISALTIDQPDLVLERGTDGTPNWQFTPAHKALFQSHSGSSSGGGDHHIEIRHVELQGGFVTWQPAQGAPRRFAVNHAVLSEDNNDSPLTLSFDGAYQGVAGAVPLTLTGNSGSLQRLQGGPVSALAGPWPLNLTLTTQGTDLRVEGGISHPDQARSYQFRLTGHSADLSQLNGFLAKPYLPPLAGVNFNAVVADDSQGVPRTSQVSVHAENSDLGTWVPGLVVKQALLSAPGPGQLVQLSVDGTYTSQPLRLAAAVMQPDVTASTAPLQLTMTGQAAGTTIDLHGTLPPSLGASGLDVQMDAKAADLSTLSPFVGKTLPPAHDVSLTAELQDAGVKLRGITVHDLVFASSLGDVTGELTVNWTPRNAVTGTLVSRTLDLDAILNGTPGQLLPQIWPPPENSTPPVQPEAPPAPAPSPAAVPAPSAPTAPAANALVPPANPILPLQALRNNDVDLSLTIGDLTTGAQHYRDLSAHLQLQDGKLTLNPFRAQAPEGALIGGISVDATTDQPPVAFSFRSPSISASSLVALFGHPGEASGTMQVDAELSGIGQSLPGFEASMNGHLGLAMINGQVNNALVETLVGDALQTAGVPSMGDGTSQVRCFAMRTDFVNGVGTIKALAADTSRLSLSGDGTIDLGGGTADLHLRPQIRLGPTEVAAPVSVQGPFGAMKATLDPVMGNGRVGIQIGGDAPSSGCVDKLALARNGLGGPIPPAAPPPTDPGLTFKIKKPKDLLQGLFH
jgi:AsmA protein